MVSSPDVIMFPYAPTAYHCLDPRTVILDIEPVADIRAVTIDWDSSPFDAGMDNGREKFFIVLVWAVVIRTVGRGRGQSIRPVIGPYEVIGRRLAGRIRRVGDVGHRFAPGRLVGS